jgi:drug/metabolite transporter (DMT)-like permease
VTLQVLGGVLLAAVAAACYDAGLALQALDARTAPREHGLRLSLLLSLARRRRWLAATALSLAGWPFYLLALSLAPLSVVQPTLALGLVLLLFLGRRVLGERIGLAERSAVAGVVGAVALVAWAAPPATSHHAGAGKLAIALVPLALIALLPLVAGRLGEPPAKMLPLAAGVAFAVTDTASKLLVDDFTHSVWGGVVLWATALGVFGLAGVLLEMSALQRRPATIVGPTVFVLQVTLPVLLAPLVAGESWRGTPLNGGVILIGVAITAACAVVLTRSTAVAAFSERRQT